MQKRTATNRHDKIEGTVKKRTPGILPLLLTLLIAITGIWYQTEHGPTGHGPTIAIDLTQKAEAAPLKPIEQPQIEPVAPLPVKWAVTTSPHAKVPVSRINEALAHYQNMGMSKQGAAYLVGNFVGESYLTDCGQWGDGGRAHGLAQWHPGRRQDMPCGFTTQLTWAVNVEMARHTPELKNCLFNPSCDVATIKSLLYQWERWGVLGGRWQYSAHIYSQI